MTDQELRCIMCGREVQETGEDIWRCEVHGPTRAVWDPENGSPETKPFHEKKGKNQNCNLDRWCP